MIYADIYTFLEKIERSKRVSSFFWFGPMFWFVAKKPEEIKIILNSDETFDKTDHGLSVIVEHGMLTDGGEKYKLERKSISPFFSTSNLRRFFPIINKKMSEFIKRFDSDLPSSEFNITSHVMDFAMDTIFSTMFNIDHVPIEKRLQLLKSMEQFLAIGSEKIFKFWLTCDYFFKRSEHYDDWLKHRGIIFDYLGHMAEKNEKNFQNNNESEKLVTLVDFLYQIRHTMSYNETMDSMFWFLGASYETTGSQIPHILLLLAMNPEQQEKCYQEICDVLSSPDDEVTENMCSELKYLERCCKEGLRLIPAALILARKVNQDLKLGNKSLNL